MRVELTDPSPPAPLAAARRPRALHAVALVVLALTSVLWLAWVVATALGPGGLYDFTTYYAAATALRLDPHANIYAAGVLAHAATVAGGLPYHPLPYTYPPLLAILLVPLTLLPFGAAAACWLVFNAALWLACALLLAGEVRHILAPTPTISAHGLPARDATILALTVTLPLCLLSWPAGSSLLLGQVGILVLAPLALVPTLLRRGHNAWAGAAIALAAMLKFTPLLLLGYLLLTRRWSALRAALLALVALALLCLLVVGPGVALQALPQALHVGADDATHANNQALFGLLLVAIHGTAPTLDPVARLLEYAVLLAIAVAAALLLWRASPPSSYRATPTASPRWSQRDAAAYALALCALLLVAPVAWSHHYVWLLPANALVLGIALQRWRQPSTREEHRAAARQLGVVALASLLINISAAYVVQQALMPIPLRLLGFTLSAWTNQLPAVGALLLFCVAARQLRADHTSPVPSPETERTHG